MRYRNGIRHIDVKGRVKVYQSVRGAAVAVGRSEKYINRFAEAKLYAPDGSRFEYFKIPMGERTRISLLFENAEDQQLLKDLDALAIKTGTYPGSIAKALIRIGFRYLPDDFTVHEAPGQFPPEDEPLDDGAPDDDAVETGA